MTGNIQIVVWYRDMSLQWVYYDGEYSNCGLVSKYVTPVSVLWRGIFKLWFGIEICHSSECIMTGNIQIVVWYRDMSLQWVYYDVEYSNCGLVSRYLTPVSVLWRGIFKLWFGIQSRGKCIYKMSADCPMGVVFWTFWMHECVVNKRYACFIHLFRQDVYLGILTCWCKRALNVSDGARCSSVVRVSAHGAMGHRIDPSWWTHWAISHSSQCSTTGVTKAAVCVILSVGWCI